MRILILSNNAAGLYLFRRELLRRLAEDGYNVFVSAPETDNEYIDGLRQCRCHYTSTEFNRRGKNPLKDISLLVRYLVLIRRIRPDVVLTYTIKPNVYAGMACAHLKVPCIANVTGLAVGMERENIVQKLMFALYRRGLRNDRCVFFQNENDRDTFENKRIYRGRCRLLPGSGVNLAQYAVAEYPDEKEPIVILYAGRMVADKGTAELLEAIEAVRGLDFRVVFQFVGEDAGGYFSEKVRMPDSVRYAGPSFDMQKWYGACHAVIMPSWFEGMSNVCLEAAAAGRPVLASNVHGCMETFDEGVSGFGFEPKSPASMAAAIGRFLALPHEDKKRMGLAGRAKMEREFDRNLVVTAYLEEIGRICNPEGSL